MEKQIEAEETTNLPFPPEPLHDSSQNKHQHTIFTRNIYK